MFDVIAKATGAVVLVFLSLCLISFICAIPTYFLWNWLAPTLFGFKLITLWQAWGLNLLCGMLFKGSSSSS